MVLAIVLTVAGAYLLGNLNGSVLISRIVAGDDVRKHGSGNAGFTNFFRNYGGVVSLAVIVIDGVKAALACYLGGWLLGKYGFRMEGMTLGALAVCLGHDFPALLGFRGGKGIMSGFGALIAMDWRIAIVVGGLFLAVYLLTFYVSLASIVGALTYAAGFAVVYHKQPIAMVLGMSVAFLALFMHRENMVRLMKGTERKTNFFKKGSKK